MAQKLELELAGRKIKRALSHVRLKIDQYTTS